MTKTKTSVNFVHVEENSQFYTDLKQIETSLMHANSGHLTIDYMLVSIRNTMKMGYKLTPPKKTKRGKK